MTQDQKPLYNPLSRPVEFEWNDDQDQTHTITLDAVAITYVPENQYEFSKKRLADAVWIDRGAKVGHDEYMPGILKEITVEI